MDAQAIEVMARAAYEQIHREGQMICVSWDSDDPVMESVRASHRKTATEQLAALQEVGFRLWKQRDPKDCYECGKPVADGDGPTHGRAGRIHDACLDALD